jgi:hypothetical protein
MCKDMEILNRKATTEQGHLWEMQAGPALNVQLSCHHAGELSRLDMLGFSLSWPTVHCVMNAHLFLCLSL